MKYSCPFCAQWLEKQNCRMGHEQTRTDLTDSGGWFVAYWGQGPGMDCFFDVEASRLDDEGLSSNVASCIADYTFDIPETSSLKALFQLTEQHLGRAARFDAIKETQHFGNELHFVLTEWYINLFRHWSRRENEQWMLTQHYMNTTCSSYSDIHRYGLEKLS